MSSQSQIIPALGRPFGLGMLYDRRSEKLIIGKTLWSSDHLGQAVNTISKPYTNSEILAEDTTDDKTRALNIEGSIKLSFLGGLVNIQGAAKYLDDRKTSSHHSRVVLKYETTTELKQLTMEHLGRGKVQYPEVFDQDIATDVVVGILYGAKAFLIFDQEVSKDESMEEVHGNMEVLVKSLPGISTDITEDQKKKTEKMHCKMYGDFRTGESPTTYEEAVRVYKQLPSLIGDKGQNAVAVQVYLRPLSEIDGKGQRMVREISADYIRKTCEIQEHIQCIESKCSDLMREDVCSSFPRIKKQLSSFKSNIWRYKIFFQKKLLALLPSIRGGGAEESALGDIFEEKERSPFAQTCIDTWIVEKEKEMKRLQVFIRFLGGTPFVSPEDVENKALDPSTEHVVCCTFKIGKEDDPQILSMDGYLTGKVLPELKTKASSGTDDKNVNKRIRQTLKQFSELKIANEDHKEVKFFATEECLSDNFSGDPGAFIYLYEEGEQENDDFKLSPKPENLEAESVRDDSIKLWWNDPHWSENKIENYKVQYKKNEANSDWITQYTPCGKEVKKTATISGLQPATSYLVRVCAVGQIVVSQYGNTLSATTKPTSPPGKPTFADATTDTITIAFTKPKSIGRGVNIEKYKIEWIFNSQQMKQFLHYTEDVSPTCTIKGLQAGVPYNFSVTAICGSEGDSNPSDLSNPLQTMVPPTNFDTRKILGCCSLVQPSEDGKPAVYTLPLTQVHEDSRSQLRKFVINIGEKEMQLQYEIKTVPEKVMMVVGATGSGKTTTVNAMINHVLGVQWKDDFRLKMIHELSSNQGAVTIGNQAHSQTQFVSCYTLPYMEGFKILYTLTIVDTPGFGDTRGIEHDKMITEQIRRFFNTKGSAGIDHIDAICFIAQAGNPRLTPTQQYVFDRILAMFGKDIKKNVLVLFTFADGQKPQALSAMLEAGILEDESNFFKFNNSALFVANSGEEDEENFDRMFWRMGIKSFEKFFHELAKMEPKSLVLTKQVLDERAQLEVRLSGLREKIVLGVNTLSELQQLTRVCKQHAADINANKNFKFTVEQAKRVQVELPIGQYTTNCLVCNYTCHFPCRIPRNENKKGCAAMSFFGSCRECPHKCHWSKHVNDAYRYDTQYETVEKEYDEIKERFDIAVEGQSKVEAIIKQVEQDFNKTNSIVLNFVAEMQRGLKKLSEIALKKDPLQQVDYLDLLIESEKSQAKPGWQDRVSALQIIRDAAVQINRLGKPGFDPWKDFRENEDTRQFFQKQTEQAQASYMNQAWNATKKKVCKAKKVLLG
ncbi:unnamed protein product [Porites evermanni]|uniref:Fibronectin type-III domain-containing protein n=1 Tax=Porites evermanni TaxID=104178 RepID=A0ABN8RVJ8_9CNID|nr:unnamed protein product [Porites evermanni]